MIETKLVQRNKYIVLELDNRTLTTRWGKIGGKEQKTSHTYDAINVGKKNELSPGDAAYADYFRKRTKKEREGYIRVSKIVEQVAAEEKLNFNSPQTSFTLSKPVTKISDKALQKLIDSDNAVFGEKENGMCHWVIIDSKSKVKIFTRRMNDHTSKYPGIVKAFENVMAHPDLAKEFPKAQSSYMSRSAFAVELVVGNSNHHTGFRLLQEISKSNTLKGECKEDQSKALSLQKVNTVRACVFACLYAGTFPVWKTNCRTSLKTVDEMFPLKSEGETLFKPVELEFDTVAEVKQYIKDQEERLEGLVVWDKTKAMEVTFNGKPRRRAAYKIKVPREGDVIAYGWTEGTGDHQDNIGALQIGRIRSTPSGKVIYDQNLLDYGRCGSGISDELMNPDLWEFPCVIEIEYEYHEPTGKFKFPRFSKVHEDKQIWECVAEEGEAPKAVLVDFENLPEKINL